MGRLVLGGSMQRDGEAALSALSYSAQAAGYLRCVNEPTSPEEALASKSDF
jgi:hypothetical protein